MQAGAGVDRLGKPTPGCADQLRPRDQQARGGTSRHAAGTHVLATAGTSSCGWLLKAPAGSGPGLWVEMLKPTPEGVGFNSVNVRRRPTLPRPPGRSTIGAGGLNFQVRNGDWVFPRRYGHRNSIKISTNHTRTVTTPTGCWLLGLTVFREPYSERETSLRYISADCFRVLPTPCVVCDKPSAY